MIYNNIRHHLIIFLVSENNRSRNTVDDAR